MEIRDRISSHFEILYGKDEAPELVERLQELLASYGFNVKKAAAKREGWDERDTVLITYGDVIQPGADQDDAPRLQLLQDFLDRYLREIISTVHVLPFFPSSSDAGFSVIDYKTVRDDLGSWNDIKTLTEQYKIMADMVINHASRFSEWFENYEKGAEPGKDYFIEVEPDTDLSGVMRPRDTPLVTSVQTEEGLRHVWTTFSDDQIDLNFSNPDVLFEFLDIFLFYYTKGIRVMRLDAIAYLWKEVGTASIHLKETHQVVKLFRDIVECIDPEITLITETNVPFEENISYFGEQDEAHMIYQFSLPPLLLHAILTENARYLTEWAASLPELPENCTFFNFTASHDGIGVRPIEGLVPAEEINYLVQCTKDRGGFVSYKENSDGGQSPYELNITYFDVFEDPGNPRTDLQKKKYLCSQIIALSMQGVPGIYFHNFMATKNHLEGVLESGTKRDINRLQWNRDELVELIEDPDRINHEIFETYKSILGKRIAHPAFHPAARQQVLNISNKLFVFLRISQDEEERILVVCNLSNDEVQIGRSELEDIELPDGDIINLLEEETVFKGDEFRLEPFQVAWLKL